MITVVPYIECCGNTEQQEKEGIGDLSREVREMIHEDIHVDEERTACSNSLIQVQAPCGF